MIAQFGYIRVASAIPTVEVGNCKANAKSVMSLIDKATDEGVDIICFPELCTTGYTCADLFAQRILLDNSDRSLLDIKEYTTNKNLTVIIGAPLRLGARLLNAAVVISQGHIFGAVPKTFLPNYNEFYEKRWFVSGKDVREETVELGEETFTVSRDILFETKGVKFSIELCEDLWSPIPPSSELALKGADIVFNLSASNEVISKHKYLEALIAQQSARTISGYVYSSAGFGESTQDVVYAGNALIFENGRRLAANKRFTLGEQIVCADIDIEYLRSERQTNTSFTDSIGLYTSGKSVVSIVIPSCKNPKERTEIKRYVDPHPFVPSGKELDERCEEIFAIQVEGLAKRIVHTHASTVVLGISGGLDSTLALLVCVKTMDLLGRSRKDIVGVTMPGFGTTKRTHNNANSLMESLGITMREISIKEACTLHFKDIGHDIDNHDVTYENGQARERTQVLMDLANQLGGFVVGTGDLSELALGWATYNADHMSNYGVNCSIPKTLVKHLVSWVANNSVDEDSKATLLDIIDTPISPELIPADEHGNIKQKTEDLVGPYELHDFFLYNFLRLRYRPSKIYILAKSVFTHPETEGTGTYDEETIKKWLRTFCRRFFTQQFKRSCLPDGPKVGSVSLSPRGDWRMPSDASYSEWVENCPE